MEKIFLRSFLSVLLLASFGSEFSQAQEEQPQQETPIKTQEQIPAENEFVGNIKKGNFQVSGTARWSSIGVTYDYFNISPSVLYFVSDYFALGGRLSLGFGSGTNEQSIGPEISYYFWHDDRLAAYVSQAIRYTHSEFRSGQFDSTVSQSSVGIKYFINPYIAIGPTFSYIKNFYEEITSNSTELLVDFTIYL